MAGRMEMLGCVSVWGIVTAADVSARPAKTQVNPRRPQFQAFLASARARRDFVDASHVGAVFAHRMAPIFV